MGREIIEEQGIVIRTYPSGEADLILRIMARERGKISLIARYSRNSKRRFSGGFDLFDCGMFAASRGSGSLYRLSSFSLPNSLIKLRDDLDKFSLASVLCEAYDNIVKEHPLEPTESIELYENLWLGLKAIEQSSGVKEGLRGLFMALSQLLAISGHVDLSEAPPPSAKSLYALCSKIESVSERELRSKSNLEGLMSALQSSMAATSATTTSGLK